MTITIVILKSIVLQKKIYPCYLFTNVSIRHRGQIEKNTVPYKKIHPKMYMKLRLIDFG